MNPKDIELAARFTLKLSPEAEQATAAMLREVGLSDSARFITGFKAAPLIDDSSMLRGMPLNHEITAHEMQSFDFLPAAGKAASGNPFKNNLNLDRSLAYKVLDLEGRSPIAPSVQWSLPTKLEDGSWKAGDWMHLHNTPENPTFMATRRALHVSNVPEEWNLGHRNVRIFEAELAPSDGAIWKKLVDGKSLTDGERYQFGEIAATLRDFPAGQVRLVKELGS